MICKNSEKFKFRVDKCRLIPQKQGSVLFKSCRYLQYTIIKPHISSQHQFIDIHTSTGGSWGPWSRWQSPRCSAPRSAWPRSRNNVTCHVSCVMCHVSRVTCHVTCMCAMVSASSPSTSAVLPITLLAVISNTHGGK